VPTSPPAGFDLGQLTSVTSNGDPLAFVSQLPAQFQPAFIQGFHQAFTIALANSMLLGVGAAVLAVIASLLLKELRLRTHVGAEPGTGGKPGSETARLTGVPAPD
jgi:ABC-type Fe3+ transport system permease subunit